MQSCWLSWYLLSEYMFCSECLVWIVGILENTDGVSYTKLVHTCEEWVHAKWEGISGSLWKSLEPICLTWAGMNPLPSLPSGSSLTISEKNHVILVSSTSMPIKGRNYPSRLLELKWRSYKTWPGNEECKLFCLGKGRKCSFLCDSLIASAYEVSSEELSCPVWCGGHSSRPELEALHLATDSVTNKPVVLPKRLYHLSKFFFSLNERIRVDVL